MKVLVMFQRECVREVEPNARESMSEVVGFEPQIQQQHHPRLFLRNLLSLHECRVCSSFFLSILFYSILSLSLPFPIMILLLLLFVEGVGIHPQE